MKQYLYLVVVALSATTEIKAMDTIAYSKEQAKLHKAYSELLKTDQPPLTTPMRKPLIYPSNSACLMSTIVKEFGIDHIIKVLEKLSAMRDNLDIWQLKSLEPAGE